MPQSDSPKNSLNSIDIKKVAVGAGLAAAGAAVAYLAEWIGGHQDSLGSWGPLIGATVAIVLNLIRKYTTDNTVQ